MTAPHLLPCSEEEGDPEEYAECCGYSRGCSDSENSAHNEAPNFLGGRGGVSFPVPMTAWPDAVFQKMTEFEKKEVN